MVSGPEMVCVCVCICVCLYGLCVYIHVCIYTKLNLSIQKKSREYKPQTNLLKVLVFCLWVAVTIIITTTRLHLIQCYMPVCVLDLLCLCQVAFSQQTYEVGIDSNKKEPHTLRDLNNKKFIFYHVRRPE